MYTQCPGCLTLFEVERRQLAAAGGVVRCGLCGEAFNALTSLSDRLPDGLPLDADERKGPDADEAPPGAAGEEPGSDRQEPVSAAAWTGGSGMGEKGREHPARRSSDGSGADWHLTTALEVESAPGERRSRRTGWLWGSAAVLALAALALQLLWFQRLDLAREPAWRPWIERLCAVAGCELPPPVRPDAVQVRERTLQVHPRREGMLLFTATIVNDAGRPVAWPQLGLRLQRLNGTLAGERWFVAEEYLAGGELPGEAMPPEETFAVRVTIEDPGAGADSFEVRFR